MLGKFDFTTQDQGSDDTRDSDVNTSGRTPLFSMDSEKVRDHLDAGLIEEI